MGKKKHYQVKTIQRAADGLTTDLLLVTNDYDDKLYDSAKLYAKYPLKGAKIRKVGSWAELAKLLSEYKNVDRLIIYLHGTPGALLLGGVHEELDGVGEKYFKGKKMPKVKQLDLEACSVAESPEKTVPFAKLFAADRVSAWNYFHVGMKITVKVPAGVDKAKLDEMLKPYKGYLLENTPSTSEMAGNPGTYEIGAEWFRDDLNDDPLPALSGGGLDSRAKTFKPRSSKAEVTLKSMKEVQAYVDKYKNDPVRPLEHVTIDLSSMK